MFFVKNCTNLEVCSIKHPAHLCMKASDVQGYTHPHGYAGKGIAGKGWGGEIPTRAKHAPSARVWVTRWVFSRVRLIGHRTLFILIRLVVIPTTVIYFIAKKISPYILLGF